MPPVRKAKTINKFSGSFAPVPPWKWHGPRHTTNPSHIRNFWVQKLIHKKRLFFSEKVYRHFKILLHQCLKHLRRHYLLKIRPHFDLRKFKIFDFRKYAFFGHFPISLNFICGKSLTQCCLKYYRSIKKNWWYTPRPHPKWYLLEEGLKLQMKRFWAMYQAENKLYPGRASLVLPPPKKKENE